MVIPERRSPSSGHRGWSIDAARIYSFDSPGLREVYRESDVVYDAEYISSTY